MRCFANTSHNTSHSAQNVTREKAYLCEREGISLREKRLVAYLCDALIAVSKGVPREEKE